MTVLSTAQAHFKNFWGREEALVLGGMLGLGIFWIALYSKFFLFHKFF